MRRLAWALAFCSGLACAQQPLVDGGALFGSVLSDLQEQPVAMASLRGKPLVVNFWARWCAPCREEIPELAKRASHFRGAGVEVVGIAIDDKVDAVRDFARAYEMNYRVVLAKDQGIALLTAIGDPMANLPVTLAFDRQGKVVYHKLGRMRPADMDGAFRAALEQR